MSVATAFRTKMDAALNSADRTRKDDPDSRRASLQRDLEKAGYLLMEKDMLLSLMETINKLQIDATPRGTLA